MLAYAPNIEAGCVRPFVEVYAHHPKKDLQLIYTTEAKGANENVYVSVCCVWVCASE